MSMRVHDFRRGLLITPGLLGRRPRGWRSVLALVAVTTGIGGCSADSGATGSRTTTVTSSSPAPTSRNPSSSSLGASSSLVSDQTEFIDCVLGYGEPGPTPADDRSIVLDVVSMRTKQALQTGRLDRSPTAWLFAKDGLWFRAGVAFDLDVAPESRGILKMGWSQPNGDRPVEHVHVPVCTPVGAQIPVGAAQTSWLGFVGGYYVKDPACVAIIVTVGQTQQTVHLGVGAPCPGQQPPSQPSDT